MKKVTGQKKLQQPDKSQPNILSFFSKPAHSKLTLKKTKNPQNALQNDIPKIDTIASQSNSLENESKIIEKNIKHNITECAIEEKCSKSVVSPDKTINKLSIDKKNNYIADKKINENKPRHYNRDINKAVIDSLTKGKHHLNDDHCVPSIVVNNSPSKKIKLSNPRMKSPNKKILIELDKRKEMEYVDLNIVEKVAAIDALKNDNFNKTNIICSKDIVVNLNLDDLGVFEEDFSDLNPEVTKENLNPHSESNHSADDLKDSPDTGCNVEELSELFVTKENLNPHSESNHSADDLKDSPDTGCNVKELSELFDDDWNMNDIDCSEENATAEELDLTHWQRCEIINFTTERNTKIVKLKESNGAKHGTCTLEGSWFHADIKVGDTVSLIAPKQSGVDAFKICNESGYLVQWPDTLVSGTDIVSSVFCQRKAVLQHRFKGIDCNNKSMVIGSLVHQLLQTSLSKGLFDVKDIKSECRAMLNSMECVYMIYEADMSQDMASEEMMQFAPQISHFIGKYVTDEKLVGGKCLSGFDRRDLKKKRVTEAAEWDGTINRIVDIEENIWSPRLGVKGKVDVTVEVTIHDQKNGLQKKLMPLELKTGKASQSSEHRGQVILYTMLMTAIASGDTKDVDIGEGLLLYLRNSIGIHQVTAGRSEKRDLLMLRNQLAYYIATWCKPDNKNKDVTDGEKPETVDSVISPKNVRSVVDDFKYEIMELPGPINHHSACGRCPYATICSIHLSKDPTVELSASHPLRKVIPDSIGHLSPSHIDYFLRMCQLLAMEDGEAFVQNPLKDIWTMDPREREKRGKCLINMKIDGAVVPLRDRFEHTLRRHITDSHLMADIQLSGLQVGEYIILSTKSQIAVSAGTIIFIDKSIVTLLLDRDITKRNQPSTLYYLDYYESQSFNLYNLTNIGVLMDQTEVSSRLRRIVIDKDVATFSSKISRHILDKGKNILSKLNKVQQRAVLKAISTNDYMLIKGMPGTGKTQTIVALVELLVLLGKTVLITSQTHSAVDNVLGRLRHSAVKILRIGPSGRIHQQLLPFSESVLTKNCKSPEDLHSVYTNANVVGVTCIGAKHALFTKRTFDVCIIDESTQVLQCTVLRALFSADKFILVGDSEQLPPIVRSKSARLLGLAVSLFDRLDSATSTVNLNLQYRMNEPIMNLANWFTYKGQLQCANDAVRTTTLAVTPQLELLPSSDAWLKSCISTELKDSVVIIDTGNSASLLKQYGDSQYNGGQPQDKKICKNRHRIENVCEAALVLNIITELLRIGVRCEEIGVIAPFRDQVALLQKVVSKLTNNLKTISKGNKQHPDKPTVYNDATKDESGIIDIEVNTVDQYQGRDKQVIIYSCTKTLNLENNRLHEFSETDILNDKRRLTVAITRAKNKLIIVGDLATLQFYKPFKELFREVNLRRETNEDEVSLVDLKVCQKFQWHRVMRILAHE